MSHAFMQWCIVALLRLFARVWPLQSLINSKGQSKGYIGLKTAELWQLTFSTKVKKGFSDNRMHFAASALGRKCQEMIHKNDTRVFSHFFLLLRFNKPVNRDLCQCSCWDTVFKGKFLSIWIDHFMYMWKCANCFAAGYETGVGGYKHIYFNCTRNTLIIWALTVIAVIGLYEAVRHIFSAMYYGEYGLVSSEVMWWPPWVFFVVIFNELEALKCCKATARYY